MKKETTYKIKLTEKQMNTICTITRKSKSKRARLMSILSYLIKYTDKTTNSLTRSLNELYTMYIKMDYRKIGRSYFYRLVDILKENNLLPFALPGDRTRDELGDKIETSESIENTSIENDLEKNNNIINNTILNTYTLYTSNDVEPAGEKVSALDLVEDVFKDFKIKSKIIKNMVIAKLKNIKLDITGAVAYIVKVITEKTEQYNAMRVKYAQTVAKTKYSKSKNTYVSSNKNNTRTFNNFEPRQYDYDALEEKLLRWE